MNAAQGPQTTPQPARRAADPIGLAFLAAAVVVLLWRSAGVLRYIAAAVRYPFELGYGEGQVFVHTELLLSGQPMYGAVHPGRELVSNYPPFYHAVSAVMSRLI